MTHRGYRRHAEDAKSLAPFRVRDHAPSRWAEHEGVCACGKKTSRSFQGIGWQCYECGEAFLRAQFAKALSDSPEGGR
jgi:tRNA(Ile2) C34 agmatinyltransferase TiaS